MKHLNSYFVMPAKAGIQAGWCSRILIEDKNVNFHLNWIPAYAGMTAEK